MADDVQCYVFYTMPFSKNAVKIQTGLTHKMN